MTLTSLTNKDEIILACTQALRDRLPQFTNAILETNLPSDEKLRRYVLERFRAAKKTREGSDCAAEIARTVIRLAPKRIEEETTLMLFVRNAHFSGRMHDQHISPCGFRDGEVFAYAIAYFFPIPEKEPDTLLEEQKLLAVVN